MAVVMVAIRLLQQELQIKAVVVVVAVVWLVAMVVQV
jgi:hypothetical protein